MPLLSEDDDPLPALVSLNSYSYTEVGDDTYFRPYGVILLQPNSGPVGGLFKVKDLYQKKVLLRDAGLELQQISLLLKLKFYHTQELLVGLPKLWHLHQHQHFQEMSHFL